MAGESAGKCDYALSRGYHIRWSFLNCCFQLGWRSAPGIRTLFQHYSQHGNRTLQRSSGTIHPCLIRDWYMRIVHLGRIVTVRSLGKLVPTWGRATRLPRYTPPGHDRARRAGPRPASPRRCRGLTRFVVAVAGPAGRGRGVVGGGPSGCGKSSLVRFRARSNEPARPHFHRRARPRWLPPGAECCRCTGRRSSGRRTGKLPGRGLRYRALTGPRTSLRSR